MRSNQVQGQYRRELENAALVPLAQPIALENGILNHDIIERAAQALFEFVFSSCGRVKWATCDEDTKEGFRGEARVVIEAILPRLFR